MKQCIHALVRIRMANARKNIQEHCAVSEENNNNVPQTKSNIIYLFTFLELTGATATAEVNVLGSGNQL